MGMFALLAVWPATVVGGNGVEKESVALCQASAGYGVKTIRLGDLTVTWIADNETETMQKRSLFKDASDELMAQLGLQNGVPSSISTFLVEKNGVKMLFDTGYGNAGSCLLKRMARLHVSPSDIKYLFLTHFHGDHICGMMKGDSIVFPHAQVYASKLEYDAWMNHMPAERNARQVKVMTAYKKQLHLFDFGDTLPEGVVAMDAVGHTPGHTAYRLGKLLVVGDLMHGFALQSLHPQISAAYDMDKVKAAASRKRLLEYAKKHHLLMAGMHFPAPAMIQE